MQQRKCLAEKTLRKTRGYNKKWLKRGKRQFLAQNGVFNTVYNRKRKSYPRLDAKRIFKPETVKIWKNAIFQNKMKVFWREDFTQNTGL